MHTPYQQQDSNPDQVDVFLSYSRADDDIMRAVMADLQDEGLRVWIDETEIAPGTPSWRNAIEHGIDNAHCVLVIFSPDSKQSHWVGEELHYAELQQKRIFSLLARGTPQTAVRFGYAAHQWIDIRNVEDYENGIRQLIETICDHIGIESKSQRLARERAAAEEAAERRRTEEEVLKAEIETLANQFEAYIAQLAPDELAEFEGVIEDIGHWLYSEVPLETARSYFADAQDGFAHLQADVDDFRARRAQVVAERKRQAEELRRAQEQEAELRQMLQQYQEFYDRLETTLSRADFNYFRYRIAQGQAALARVDEGDISGADARKFLMEVQRNSQLLKADIEKRKGEIALLPTKPKPDRALLSANVVPNKKLKSNTQSSLSDIINNLIVIAIVIGIVIYIIYLLINLPKYEKNLIVTASFPDPNSYRTGELFEIAMTVENIGDEDVNIFKIWLDDDLTNGFDLVEVEYDDIVLSGELLQSGGQDYGDPFEFLYVEIPMSPGEIINISVTVLAQTPGRYYGRLGVTVKANVFLRDPNGGRGIAIRYTDIVYEILEDESAGTTGNDPPPDSP